MRVVRAMFLFAARRNINIILKHVPGKSNDLADSLSRFQVHKFRLRHPEANNHPDVVPEEVWNV